MLETLLELKLKLLDGGLGRTILLWLLDRAELAELAALAAAEVTFNSSG